MEDLHFGSDVLFYFWSKSNLLVVLYAGPGGESGEENDMGRVGTMTTNRQRSRSGGRKCIKIRARDTYKPSSTTINSQQ